MGYAFTFNESLAASFDNSDFSLSAGNGQAALKVSSVEKIRDYQHMLKGVPSTNSGNLNLEFHGQAADVMGNTLMLGSSNNAVQTVYAASYDLGSGMILKDNLRGPDGNSCCELNAHLNQNALDEWFSEGSDTETDGSSATNFWDG